MGETFSSGDIMTSTTVGLSESIAFFRTPSTSEGFSARSPRAPYASATLTKSGTRVRVVFEDRKSVV